MYIYMYIYIYVCMYSLHLPRRLLDLSGTSTRKSISTQVESILPLILNPMKFSTSNLYLLTNMYTLWYSIYW